MPERNQLNNSNLNAQAPQLNPEEVAKLFDYPAVGELFSDGDTRRLDDFCSRLAATRDNLERIIRYGDRDEAERARRAASGIETTLEFPQNLQKLRVSDKK